MNMTKQYSRTLLSCGIAAAITLAGAQAFAAAAPAADSAPAVQSAAADTASGGKSADANATRAATPLIDRDAVARYPGWENPALMRVAVRSGRAVVAELHRAHDALDQGDAARAREELAAAGAYSSTIRFMSPYTVVTERLSNDRQETLGTSSRVLVDDMLPIYSSIRNTTAYQVEQQAQANQESPKGAQPGATAKADQMDQAGQAVAGKEKIDEVGEDIAASTLYLPVRYVSSHIGTALQALEQKTPDMKGAQGAVDDALDSLIRTTVDLRMQPQQGGLAGGAAAARPDATANTQGHS